MSGLYYRRKVLLALLEAFGGRLKPLDFQKYLFLFAASQGSKSYHFVPYKFGGFSFQSYADKSALIKYGYLKDSDEWVLTRKQKTFTDSLSEEDQNLLKSLTKNFSTINGTQLVKYIYKKYPFYAINSTIAAKVLSPKELEAVKAAKPQGRGKTIFTIGYEGRTIEEYINKLIENDVRVLCDVRKNPLSRKFGFSKNQLRDLIGKVGIEYLHIPELGIESKYRKNLNDISDYKKLFREYKKSTLPKNQNQLTHLEELLEKKKRVAITCFEAESHMCHRSCVSEALEDRPNSRIQVMDL